MELLQGLEHSGLVRAVKASFLTYPLLNAAHILAVGALLTSVLLIDLTMMGSIRSVPERPFHRLMRRVALIGFVGAVATGLCLFAVRATEYAAMPVFLAKVALIALAGANFLLFLRLERRTPENERPGAAARLLAMGSLAFWFAAFLCGRFIGFLA
ncbi:MAG: hypothetical protein ABWZ57_15775 [Mesorhizobium sp.]